MWIAEIFPSATSTTWIDHGSRRPGDTGHGRTLDAAVDDVRARFGTTAITRAVLLHHDHGHSVPLLPD